MIRLDEREKHLDNREEKIAKRENELGITNDEPDREPVKTPEKPKQVTDTKADGKCVDNKGYNDGPRQDNGRGDWKPKANNDWFNDSNDWKKNDGNDWGSSSSNSWSSSSSSSNSWGEKKWWAEDVVRDGGVNIKMREVVEMGKFNVVRRGRFRYKGL